MNEDEVSAEGVDEMVQEISVGDAVNGGVEGKGEEDEVGDDARAISIVSTPIPQLRSPFG